MKIISGAVSDYKSFHAKTAFVLSDGFNVIVGKNNAGKSTLLSALGLRIGNAPFRSIATVPEPGQPPTGQSLVEMSLELSSAEVLSHLHRHPGDFYFPMAGPAQPLEAVKRNFHDLLALQTVTIDVVYSGALGRFTRINIPQINLALSTIARAEGVRGFLHPSGEFGFADQSSGISENHGGTVHEILAKGVRDRIFSFRAERVPPSLSQFAPSAQLDSTASNLGSPSDRKQESLQYIRVCSAASSS